jgi:putative DNA primase/helicase
MHTQSGIPQVLEVNLSGIPQELLVLPNWVDWKLQLEEGKEKKIPLNAKTGRFASSTDSSTWSNFDQAWKHYEQRKGHGVDGLGFMFSEDDQIAGIDLDDCRNLETGELNAFAKSILERMNSYAEKSPSGEGLHIFVKGNLPGKGINLGNIEMYDNKRFFSVTGQALSEYPSVIEERDEALKALYHEVTGKDGQADEPKSAAGTPLAPMDENLISRGTAKYGPRFLTLWGGGQDESETPSQGDLGFCTMISVLTGGNAHEIDRVFRLSGRMRGKWDKTHYSDGRTYGQGTIEKAITRAQGTIEDGLTGKVIQSPTVAFNCTDMGNGKRLVALHGHDLHYCPPGKKWFIWNGKLYLPDNGSEIMRRAKDTVQSIGSEIEASTDERLRSELVRHARSSESQTRLKGMIVCAQSEPTIDIMPDNLDQDPWLLNCLNGTLDLRTGRLRGHRRSDLITKISPVKFIPKAECPVWLHFLRKIMGENATLISFLQRAVGYSLTGITWEQCLFILWGIGKNGKTTLLEVIKALLGKDFARQAASETFMQKARGGQIPNDLAALKGARLVTAPELEKDQCLSESLIKLATGEDEIIARFLYGEYFSYKPQFKLWMMANHKPVIRGTDDGIWRRLMLIPFKVQIPESGRDRQLINKLKAELPGILNWALQGCLEWQRDGLGIPQEVQDAVAEYRKDMDILGRFIEERCIRNPKSVTPATTIYEAYTLWAEANGETNPLKQGAFGKALSDRGVDRKHLNSGWVRTGISLRPDDCASN